MKGFKRGFTLVETLIASIILCGAVLALGAIGTRSLCATKLNRHYEIAAALADKQLTYIDYIGVSNFVESGRREGVVERFEPGYRWEVKTEYEGIDNLYKVNVTVSWVERNRFYNVSVDTMLNGTGMLTETGEE